MRFGFDFQTEVWSVMPPAAAGPEADTRWVEEQIGAYAGGRVAAAVPVHEYGEIVAAASREALSVRRGDVESELFFRPIHDLAFGVVHFLLGPSPEGIEELPVTEWLLPGVPLRVDPVVAGFSTDLIREGYRVHYATTADDEDGDALTGFAYGFHQDGLSGIVFSELASGDLTAVQMGALEPVVASLRLEP